MRIHAILVFFIGLAVVVGCGDSAGGRVGVSGSVKLKGQTVKEATLSFEPLDGQDTRATALVKDGAYTIDRKQGLKPGNYLIRISAGDGKTVYNSDKPAPDGPPGPGGSANIISKELMPADWNVKSKQERTVTDANPNVFDFDIP